MKLITKIKIINWHYFWNETFDIKPIVFLTGLNGSGKSTLIDGIEVVLLGDTTGYNFNKAALGKSSRTLKGYLRGEIGDDTSGGFRYLRNGRFTSYIAIEFHDDVENKDFVLGICLDTFEDGSEEHHFFNIEDKIPENEFIVNKVPLEYKALVKYLKSDYDGKYHLFDSNRQYQEFLKKRLGGLKDIYFSLLKKSTSFSPITDITTFITEYVCNPQENLDLSHLQENILQYRRLQVESENIKKRVDKLEEISKVYSSYKEREEDFLLNKYLIERCELYSSEEKLKAFKEEIVKSEDRIKEIDNELEEYKSDLNELEKRKVRLIQDKMNNNVAKISEDLYNQKKEVNQKINEINEEISAVKSDLSYYVNSYLKESNSLLENLNKVDKDALDEDKAEEISEILISSKSVSEVATSLKSKIENDVLSVSKDDLSEFKDVTKNFKDNVSSLAISLARTISSLSKRVENLKEEQANMKKGTKPFDQRLTLIKKKLQEELSLKFNKKIDVELYCDLVSIKDEEWANAIEGYLYSQKFNLFVAPKYYLEAYNILRRLLEEYRYYSTALVDQEKIIARNYEYNEDSLASEIETEHEGARAYTNFLIGRLTKADDIEEARLSQNGITRECDLYRNFTLSKINPRLYQESFIGQDIGSRFFDEKAKQLKSNLLNISYYKELNNLITEANNLELLSNGEIEHIFKSLARSSELKGYKDTLEYLDNELSEQDTALIASLDKRLEDVDDDIKEVNAQRESLLLEKGNLTKQIESLKNDKISNEESLIKERKVSLDKNYDVSFVLTKAEPYFKEKVEQGKSYIEILSEANATLSRIQYIFNNIFNELCKLRRDYVHEYRLSYDPDTKDNDTFENELKEFRDVKLPDYIEQIHDAYLKATQQFKDDFIFKLRGAISDVEDQIENLNSALKESSFGVDLYRFTVKPSLVFRRYYDMLKDDIILEGGEDESLFLNKYKDVMEDLFRQIVDVNDDKGSNEELLQNIARFTDYRSYLDFDLIVINKESGEEQRLSKMIKKKSGGETQTPFYIAVLASFAQLYHVNQEGEMANTSRLIVFDEAFSKMDRGRIKEAVKLLRKFNLQVIISCPTDKIPDISPLVDETLVVLHTKNSSCVRIFSKLD